LSEDYARIIDKNHFMALNSLLDDAIKSGATMVVGGLLDKEDKYIPPIILSKVSVGSKIMYEEIFGPILPIVTYTNIEEAINIIRNLPKPLGLYVFSKNQKNINKVLKETSSGAVCINDTVITFLHSNLPFGGVNASGMGRARGFFGFKSFSNEKAVLKHHRFTLLKLMYPPYTGRVKKLVDVLLRYF
jgi:aldehyde dehydrogenase (NAD+)